MANREAPADREIEPGMNGLWLGVLVYRWLSLGWMATLGVLLWNDLRRPVLAAVALVVTVAWNVWFTSTRAWERPLDRWFDLALAFALLPISGYVMQPGAAGGGEPFFAASYPASAILTIGTASGVVGGMVAASLLAGGLLLSRLTNEIPAGLSNAQWAILGNGVVYYLAAGGVTGTVSRVLRRSARERTRAIEEAARERERAARLAERDAIGRRLHDSVLQTLALIDKRGREAARQESVPAEQVRALVGLAADQERELRALLNEGPDERRPGPANLGSALRSAAAGITTVPITITATGDARLPASDLVELAAAVRQALQNAESHARATSVTVFAEEADDQVVVTVRDDGTGFDYDEERLTRGGKLGLLRSIKARIEALGGAVRIETAPGRGTEVEMRLPVRQEAARG